MRLSIHGVNLPGAVFRQPDGSTVGNVHVGVQIGREPAELVRADAPAAHWTLDVDVTERDGAFEFRGPAVQGKRGERFVYLTWGDMCVGGFAMFRRAKLMLNRIDGDVMHAALASGHLVATVDLTDDAGGPRCASVKPPAIVWSAPAV